MYMEQLHLATSSNFGSGGAKKKKVISDSSFEMRQFIYTTTYNTTIIYSN